MPGPRARPQPLQDPHSRERFAILRRGAVDLVIGTSRRGHTDDRCSDAGARRESRGDALLRRERVGREKRAAGVEGIADRRSAGMQRRCDRAELDAGCDGVEEAAEHSLQRELRPRPRHRVGALPVAAGIVIEQPGIGANADVAGEKNGQTLRAPRQPR